MASSGTLRHVYKYLFRLYIFFDLILLYLISESVLADYLLFQFEGSLRQVQGRTTQIGLHSGNVTHLSTPFTLEPLDAQLM